MCSFKVRPELANGIRSSLSNSDSQTSKNPQQQADRDKHIIWRRAFNSANKHAKTCEERNHAESSNKITRRVSVLDGMMPRINPKPYVIAENVQQELLQELEQLLIQDEANRKVVRLELKQSSFPGLSVRVFKGEGRVNICFICALDTVKRKFDANAAILAQKLADRLEQNTLIQVQTNDSNDLRLLERTAQPEPEKP